MNGYVEGGYLVTIGAISTYALTLLRRERVVRRRLEAGGLPRPNDEGEPTPPATSEHR